MNHRRTITRVKHTPRTASADNISELMLSVRKGEMGGSDFCAEVSRLDVSERVRLIDALLREYKDLNNFSPATV